MCTNGHMVTNLTIKVNMKISKIIPMLERGMTVKEVATKLGKGQSTIFAWIKRLRDSGYTIKNNRRGRPSLKL